MFASKVKCKVIGKSWLSPTVFTLRFTPSKKFDFQPGQFISLIVPSLEKNQKGIKRCYSLANSPEQAKKHGYELCVKLVPGGKGTSYLASLEPGDRFEAYAPYGDFQYRAPNSGRLACFISTGTGLAPIRSILQSKAFRDSPPEHSILLFGARTQEEILYRGEFESMGIEVIHAISQPNNDWLGFKGRVSDVLKSLPRDWAWHGTDFYLCGNPEMVREVNSILEKGHGISKQAIIKEAFELAPSSARKGKKSLKVLPKIKLVAA